uniref:Oligopeptide ABC transporter substrate-binding protein n=1 Tax=uncultured organism TaxID=155900 RepID=M1PVJ1_9ZZZZ|nr:oligopeptide ABC transporter substrate-binding protein [uncultured organism]
MLIPVGFGVLAASEDIVVIQGAGPTGLDPTVHREGPTYNITLNIFDSLLRRTADGDIVPALAESYERVTEKSWIFHLREGVEFHNGEELTAEAVKFTVNRIFDPELKSTRATDLEWIEGVEVIDKYTVKITANKVFALADHYFSELQIVPPEYVKEVGDKEFNMNPVGTGPFEFVRWDQGNKVVLERNEEYWAGPSEISGVTFRFINSAASRVATLLGGDADLVADVPVSSINQIENRANTKLGVATGSRVIFVGLDSAQDTPLENVKVRQALNYAVNKDAIIENLLKGLAEKTVTLLTEKDLGFNPDVEPYGYNPEKARELLDEAGYPNGFEIEMATLSGRYINDEQVAQAIAGYLGDIGVDVKLQVMEFGAFNDKLFSKQISPMFLVGWGNPVFDASYVFDFIVRSDGLIRTIQNEEIDKLLQQGRTTTDQQKRDDYYQETVELVQKQAPCVFLYKQPVLYGMSDRLNWTPRSDEFLWMYDASVS